jgi:hypothetical protein
MDLRETELGAMEWINLAQDRDQRRVLTDTKVNFWVP